MERARNDKLRAKIQKLECYKTHLQALNNMQSKRLDILLMDISEQEKQKHIGKLIKQIIGAGELNIADIAAVMDMPVNILENLL